MSRKIPNTVQRMIDFANERGMDLSVKLDYVPPVDIQLHEWVDPDNVRSIVKAIRKAGGEWPDEMPMPVVVSGQGKTMILDGTHRTTAAIYEDMPEIPVLVVDAEAFYALQEEFDFSGFEYVHDILPHIDALAAKNHKKDTGAEHPRDRTKPAYEIAPGSLGAARRGAPYGRMPSTLKAFGRELRKLLNSPEVFSILSEGDWGAGGCWILAQALVEYLGDPAVLVAVSETRPGDLEDTTLPVSHVAVRFDDTYIDYSGAYHTKDAFLKNLAREGYQEPAIHEWTPELVQEAVQGGIPCDPRGRKELLKHLVRRFG